MLDELVVRKATANDKIVLLEFEQGVISTERPFDPTLKPDPNHYYDLDNMILDPGIEVVVAEYNKEIIASGYARIKVSKPYLQHTHHAYLGFMYVKPEYRGMGVNIKIIEKLKEFAKSKGITEIQLDVYNENERAIGAYEKAGFKKHMIRMRMPV
ncbi:MAG TPA: GNAT family N-acetyltransferase [Chitinophagaceae bacterium]|nr:GNAT family N-acetyltransferase [Chitinophagaceae bacterium]